MKKELVMGIDTSNYTTSVALMDTDGNLIANIKLPLPVREGERGLRQSDAVFAHIKNLPEAMSRAGEFLKGNKLVAVGASVRPRNIDGSYMPCFLTGVASRDSIAAATGAYSTGFSHQCGHIMAVLYGSGRTDLLSKSFVAFHISGGTTEMLRVRGNGVSFDAELIGGTADLNAGQLIDRIGVYMGLRFPAGREMEALALTNDKKLPVRKPKISGFEFNLSGLENIAMRLYDQTEDKSLVAAFVFDYIGAAISKVCDEYIERFGDTTFVFAGGVMSNTIIKKMLSDKYDAVFAEPAMSADNAVGVAALTLRSYCMESEE